MINSHRLAVGVLLASLTGCTVEPPPPAAAPKAARVTSFTASETQLSAPGQRVTLSWATTDALGVELLQLGTGPIASSGVAGSAQVTLTRSTTFVLRALGEGGDDARAVTVTVAAAQEAPAFFTAVPSEVPAGRSVTLVWNAPGASSVALRRVGGESIDVGTQRSSGSVAVGVSADSTFELTVLGKTYTAAVTVAPQVNAFALEGDAPLAGGTFKVRWSTAGASRLELTREGNPAVLASVTDAAQVKSGSATLTAPASAPVGAVLDYRLTAYGGATRLAAQTLRVEVGGRVKVVTLTAPRYLRAAAGTVAWTTTGATSLQLLRDGAVVYQAPTPAAVASGSFPFATPSAPTTFQVVARNDAGDVAVRSVTSEPAFPIALVSFTASPTTVAQGGDAVTLAWQVTGARSVTIAEQGGQTLYKGPNASGTLQVAPNRPSVTYRLDADNGTGSADPTDTLTPEATVTVTVTSPGTLTFDRLLPVGGAVRITGTTFSGAPPLFGLPTLATDAAGAAFVDISSTGTSVGFVEGDDSTARLVTLPQLAARVYGRRVSGDALSVSPNGWFKFSPTVVSGSAVPTTFASASTFAFMPFLSDLVVPAQGQVYWQVDQLADGFRLIVQWSGLATALDPASLLTFQAQLYETGKVVFAYQQLSGELGSPLVGVSSDTTTRVIFPLDEPATGRTFTFFDRSAALVPYAVEAVDYLATVQLAGALAEVSGNAVLPPGQFAITEVSPRPVPAAALGEWLEVSNFTSTPVNLRDWVLDLSGQLFPITSDLIIPANGRVLLAQSPTLGDPRGPTATALYPSTFTLPDTTGSVTLGVLGGVYSRLSWDATLAATPGTSVIADPPRAGFLYPAAVPNAGSPCAGRGSWGELLQVGTPGQPNRQCFPYALEPLPTPGFVSIAATGSVIPFATTGTTTRTLALPTPVSLFGTPQSQLSVCSAGWVVAGTSTAVTSANRTLPVATGTPLGTIAPFWDLLLTPATPFGYWQQFDPDGTPGSGDESTLISWEGRAVSAGQNLNFQVRFRANGDIEFHYGAMSPNAVATARGSSATSWLEDPLNRSALPINVNSSTAPGISENTSFRYRFLP